MRSGAGQDRGCTLLLSCTASCLQINGIIQFPGLLTFSLGINCDHPNKYRQITLKTYIYEAHLFKTVSNPEKYLCLTRRKKKKYQLSSELLTSTSISVGCRWGRLIPDGPDDPTSHLKQVKGQRNHFSSVPNWQREGEMYEPIVMRCQGCLSNNQLQIISYQVKSQTEGAVAEYFIKAI